MSKGKNTIVYPYPSPILIASNPSPSSISNKSRSLKQTSTTRKKSSVLPPLNPFSTPKNNNNNSNSSGNDSKVKVDSFDKLIMNEEVREKDNGDDVVWHESPSAIQSHSYDGSQVQVEISSLKGALDRAKARGTVSRIQNSSESCKSRGVEMPNVIKNENSLNESSLLHSWLMKDTPPLNRKRKSNEIISAEKDKVIDLRKQSFISNSTRGSAQIAQEDIFMELLKNVDEGVTTDQRSNVNDEEEENDENKMVVEEIEEEKHITTTQNEGMEIDSVKGDRNISAGSDDRYTSVGNEKLNSVNYFEELERPIIQKSQKNVSTTEKENYIQICNAPVGNINFQTPSIKKSNVVDYAFSPFDTSPAFLAQVVNMTEAVEERIRSQSQSTLFQPVLPSSNNDVVNNDVVIRNNSTSSSDVVNMLENLDAPPQVRETKEDTAQQVPYENKTPILNTLNESFGFDDFDEEELLKFDAINALASQQTKINASSSKSIEKNRYKILVSQNFYEDPRARYRIITVLPFEALSNRIDTKSPQTSIMIKDEWLNCVTTPNKTISIVWSKNTDAFTRLSNAPNGCSAVIDAKQHWLIVDPDILISPSQVSSAQPCLRRAFMGKVTPSDGNTKSGVLGQMKHDFFEQSLKNTSENLDDMAEKLSKGNIERLYEVGMSEHEVKKRLKASIKGLEQWKSNFLENEGEMTYKDAPYLTQVTNILDIEETIWSPSFGLTGKLDVTAAVNFRSKKSTLPPSKSGAIPLELKTGRRTGSTGDKHIGQVMLYSFLVEDRYGYGESKNTNFAAKGVEEDIGGIILYLDEDDESKSEAEKTPVLNVFGIGKKRGHLVSLLVLRNSLAHSLSFDSWSILAGQDDSKAESFVPGPIPPMLKNPRECGWCFQFEGCVMYHKALENGDAESSGIPDLWLSRMGHLSDGHINYFRKWLKLIDLENSDGFKLKPDIWNFSGVQREKETGNCLSFLRIVLPWQNVEDNNAYTFERGQISIEHSDLDPSLNSTRSNLHMGDSVILSTEDGHFCLLRGYVYEQDEKYIVIHSKQILRVPIIESNELSNVVFRIDKEEKGLTMSIIKQNLLKLFVGKIGESAAINLYENPVSSLSVGTQVNEEIGDFKRRRLIVDLEAPAFSNNITINSGPPDVNVNGCNSAVLCKEFEGVNSDQANAINKVLNAKDYCLIQGMPGTGKSTTLAFIIRLLLSHGKSVLVSTYTHSALDSLLLKVAESGVDFLRLGQENSVIVELRKYTITGRKGTDTLEGYEKVLRESRLVATTCLGVRHAIFSKRKFDYCIVDEAGQLNEPIALGPLRMAHVFVLVGDHQQLPPLVRNSAAKDGGMDISLFQRLTEKHPSAVVKLRHQYRMNKDIMLVANTLVYNHQLVCGNEDVADQIFHLPMAENLENIPGREWLYNVINPTNSVVFLNTDTSTQSSLEDIVIGGQRNLFEATVVKEMVMVLRKCGVEDSSIGIISPYRAQNKLLKNILGQNQLRFSQFNSGSIEVNTVDKFQGRDKSCIIVSFVRSNPEGGIGSLLQDWRRMNVIFTRAKSKLILLGSFGTLEKSGHVTEFCSFIQSQRWIMNM